MTTITYTPQTSQIILQKIQQYISQNPSGYIDLDSRIINLDEDEFDIDKINQKILEFEKGNGEFEDLDTYISRRLGNTK